MTGIPTYPEQYNGPFREDVKNLEDSVKIFFSKKKDDGICLSLRKTKDECKLELTYFVGVDWLIEESLPIYVHPKLDDAVKETNYLQMLFSALKHPEISNYTDELFQINFERPLIEIQQKQDLLTPLLVVQFLKVVQEIVRKGLKKSYYKIENNLYCKVKGKILVSKTIKKNYLNNKPLNTYCIYEVFGLNGIENRLLKKTLEFIRCYLPSIKNIHSEKYISNTFNYIMPAFKTVSEEVNLNDIKHSKLNVFYKEYSEAIRLAKMILNRFGYNVTNTQKSIIKTLPFWIDMSKLFELYVLGLLKERFKAGVQYHFTQSYQELDYLINTEDYRVVVDAKYKSIYKTFYDIDDIRQIFGYARLKSVTKELKKSENEVIDCLIIYPDQENGEDDLKDLDFLRNDNTINQFARLYKVGVVLPLI